ncbi:MAG TPA: hypothetical protein VKR27_00205, partial [Acidimicrobiales bacterium]|nr:hypothetical protein [Acidimicrobiales bacterium]
VTPGMVELGQIQAKENFEFARNLAIAGAELVVVGSTNRRALLSGYRSIEQPNQTARSMAVAKREDAVDWVRNELGPGDVVLYENDLPDHYP